MVAFTIRRLYLWPSHSNSLTATDQCCNGIIVGTVSIQSTRNEVEKISQRSIKKKIFSHMPNTINTSQIWPDRRSHKLFFMQHLLFRFTLFQLSPSVALEGLLETVAEEISKENSLLHRMWPECLVCNIRREEKPTCSKNDICTWYN